MMAMGVWEGMEVAVEGKGPGPVCGVIPLDRPLLSCPFQGHH